jgi:hypothetical protein
MDQDDIRRIIRDARPNATPKQVSMFLRENPEGWSWSDDDVLDLEEDDVLAAFDTWCDYGSLED